MAGDPAVVLGAVDGVAAAYLLVWALRRERRDKPGVAIVGGVLLVCAVVLLVAGLMRRTAPPDPGSPGLPAVAPSTASV